MELPRSASHSYVSPVPSCWVVRRSPPAGPGLKIFVDPFTPLPRTLIFFSCQYF